MNADTVTLLAEEAFGLLGQEVDEQISQFALIDEADHRRGYRFHERRGKVKEALVQLAALLPADRVTALLDLADLFAYSPDYAELVAAVLPFLSPEQRDEARRKAWVVATSHILPGQPLSHEALQSMAAAFEHQDREDPQVVERLLAVLYSLQRQNRGAAVKALTPVAPAWALPELLSLAGSAEDPPPMGIFDTDAVSRWRSPARVEAVLAVAVCLAEPMRTEIVESERGQWSRLIRRDWQSGGPPWFTNGTGIVQVLVSAGYGARVLHELEREPTAEEIEENRPPEWAARFPSPDPRRLPVSQFEPAARRAEILAVLAPGIDLAVGRRLASQIFADAQLLLGPDGDAFWWQQLGVAEHLLPWLDGDETQRLAGAAIRVMQNIPRQLKENYGHVQSSRFVQLARVLPAAHVGRALELAQRIRGRRDRIIACAAYLPRLAPAERDALAQSLDRITQAIKDPLDRAQAFVALATGLRQCGLE